jgi:hypothetical protein
LSRTRGNRGAKMSPVFSHPKDYWSASLSRLRCDKKNDKHLAEAPVSQLEGILLATLGGKVIYPDTLEGQSLRASVDKRQLAQQAREKEDFPVAGSLSLPCARSASNGIVRLFGQNAVGVYVALDSNL